MPSNFLMLTEQQVAELLGVSVHGVKKVAGKGLISYVKIGKTIRFEQAEVEAFIERNTQKSRVDSEPAAHPAGS